MKTTFELLHIDHNSERLHGLLARSDRGKGLVIHIHGTWGNFYGNTIATKLAEPYLQAGFDYATLNFPGHDTTAVQERLVQFEPALAAWIKFLQPRGKLFLQGHSLGALKIVQLLRNPEKINQNWSVDGVILLSPFDIVAFYLGKDQAAIQASMESLARWQIEHGDNYIVPKTFFSYWDISVGTLRDLAKPAAGLDALPSRNGLDGSAIAEVLSDKLVFIGGGDFAAFPTPAAVHGQLKSLSRTTTRLIPDAPHNFEGFESEVASEIASWLRRLLI